MGTPMAGFERAYRFTFYASLVAFLLGLFLPGWPGQWSGRGGIEQDKANGVEAAQHDGAPGKGKDGEAGDGARPRPGARPGHLAPA